MSAYINRLIAVMILCQITSVIVPDSERAKQAIRMLCALLSLLALISPLKNITVLTEHLLESLPTVFEASPISEHTEKESDSIYFLQYITAHYHVEEVSMIIHTDETDTQLESIELYVKNYPYAACCVMEEELQALLKIPVNVYGT